MIRCVNCRQENVLTLCKDNREMRVIAHSQYKDKLGILSALWNFKVIVLEEKCKLYFKRIALLKYLLWVCSIRSNTPPDSLQCKVFEFCRSVGWNLPSSTSSRWVTNKYSGISCASVRGHVARWRRTWAGAIYNSGLVKNVIARASDYSVLYCHYEMSHWGFDKDSGKIYEWSEWIY